MKRLKRFIGVSLILLIVAVPSLISGKDSGKKNVRKGDINSFSVYLKMEKLKFHSSEEVLLHIVIKNITDQAATFYVFDLPDDNDKNDVKSQFKNDLFGQARGDVADFNVFRPVVYGMDGRDADVIAPYVISGKQLNNVLDGMNKREITLRAGETFTHTQNLSRIYKLNSDTDYRIKLHFYPFLKDPDGDQVIISSNELKIKVVRDREYQPRKSADSKGIKLVPSEVVLLVLNAEKEGCWERAIKFIDIEKFIHSYPDFSRRYDQADDSEKKNIENEFKKYFIAKRSDYLIEFKVTGEEIEPSGLVATVSVVVSRKSTVKPERYRYVYRLEKNSLDDYMWMVSGLEATIIREVKR